MKIDDIELQKAWDEREDIIYSHVSRFMACVTKAQDTALRQQIIQYAKLKSEEYGEEVQVIFMDEDKVNRIIDLGLKEYLEEERGCKWRKER